MNDPQNALRASGDSDEIDLGQLLDILRNGKGIIVAATLGAGLIGYGYATLSTDVYQGDALLQLETESGSLGINLDDELGLPKEGPEVATQTEVLQSRSLLGSVVDKLDLTIQARPRYFPVVGEYLAGRHQEDEPAEAPFGLDGFAWGGESIQVTRLEMSEDFEEALDGQPLTLRAGEGDTYTLHAPDGRQLASGSVDEPLALGDGEGGERDLGLFVSELQARPGTEFTLSRRSRPDAIRELRGRLSIQERSEDSGVLEVSMEHPEPAFIERALDTLTENHIRQHVERKSEEAQRSLKFLEDQLPQVRQELEAAEQQMSSFRSQNDAVDLDENARALLDQLVEAENKLSELRVERNELELNYGPEHPQMEAVDQRRASLEEVKRDLEGRISQLPEKQQQALRLQREVEVSTSLYTNLLNTAQELRVARAGTVGDIFILDTAEASGGPVAPQRNLILALSLVLGGMLGVMGVFGREFLRRGIHDPDALEQALGIPVYAVVPHAPEQRLAERRLRARKQPLEVLAYRQPQDPSAESLRSLRTSLAFALMRDSRKILMITSPQPSSGKTFVSVNLAYLVAEGGSRVLVVDTDMRRGRLHNYLQERRRDPGLSDILAERASLQEAAVNLYGSNMDLIPSGTIPPNPAELLMRDRFRTLLEEAEQQYDLVVLDTAPVMAVADAGIVGTHAGATLLLARAGITGERELRAAAHRLEQATVKVSGLVLNDFRVQRTGGGYYQYYYYDYKYRSDRSEQPG